MTDPVRHVNNRHKLMIGDSQEQDMLGPVRAGNIFVLEATKAGVPQHETRKILRINIGRVNKIAKHIKFSNSAAKP